MHQHFDKYLNVKELIEKYKPEKIVELGALHGKNTVQLLTMAKVLTITDSPLGLSGTTNEVLETLRLAISDGDLEWIQSISFKELEKHDNDSMTFVSVDTDHNYMTLKLELDELYRTVKKGGIIVLHDVEICKGWNRLQKSIKQVQKYGTGEKYDIKLMSAGPGYTEALLEQVEEGRWKIIKWSKKSCGAAAIEKL